MRTIHATIFVLLTICVLSTSAVDAASHVALVPFYGIHTASSDGAHCDLAGADGWLRSAMTVFYDEPGDGSSVFTFVAGAAQVGEECGPVSVLTVELPYLAWGVLRDGTTLSEDGCVTERTVSDFRELPLSAPAGLAGFLLRRETTNSCTSSWSETFLSGDGIANV